MLFIPPIRTCEDSPQAHASLDTNSNKERTLPIIKLECYSNACSIIDQLFISSRKVFFVIVSLLTIHPSAAVSLQNIRGSHRRCWRKRCFLLTSCETAKSPDALSLWFWTDSLVLWPPILEHWNRAEKTELQNKCLMTQPKGFSNLLNISWSNPVWIALLSYLILTYLCTFTLTAHVMNIRVEVVSLLLYRMDN